MTFLARILFLGHLGQHLGVALPAIIASMIAGADFDHVPEATELNLIPASCNTFSRR